MSALPFCFVLHLHQPVGNFHHVFEDHAVDVYRPFFDFLAERELWPIGLHVSGPLLEWLGEHDPDFHDRIGRLAADGDLELLSAGWYEPILACLSREDRASQLGWMRGELESRFGVTPRGLWLTERVWEPDLPRDLADAGIEYTLVDDHLARRAGVSGASLLRPLRTEAEGRTVDVLAIDEGLRYLIPFRPAEEIEADLRRRQRAGHAMALIGDDGEKFGGWPKTKEWLYDGGWLEDFGERMDRLRDEGVVRLVAPEHLRRENEAVGPVYLPSGSYPEMEGWALGGHWKGFLARYDEANRIHKRMTALSRICRGRGDPPGARRAIGRAQCNDAYWHGVFGGLYMKHLRQGVRRELMAAERELRTGQALEWTAGDPAATGRRGWWAHGEAVSAWIDPAFGGTVTDLLWLERGVDVVDVLTRRHEAYYDEAVRRVEGATGSSEEASAPSIHEIEQAATLDRLPPIDPEVRTLVRDRVLSPDLSLETYRDGAFEAIWAPRRGRADDPERLEQGERAALRWTFDPGVDGTTGRAGGMREGEGGGGPEPRVRKTLELRDDGRLTITWRWEPEDFPPGALFAPELSLGADVELTFDPEPELWRYPIVTVSKCPDGFEKIEQGQSVTPRWSAELGRASLAIG